MPFDSNLNYTQNSNDFQTFLILLLILAFLCLINSYQQKTDSLMKFTTMLIFFPSKLNSWKTMNGYSNNNEKKTRNHNERNLLRILHSMHYEVFLHTTECVCVCVYCK